MNAIPLLLILASAGAPAKDYTPILSSILKSETKSEVTPQLVCSIQHAIKLRRTKPFDMKTCVLMARSYQKAKARGVPPILPLSMSINESDLYPDRESKGILKAYPEWGMRKKLKVKDHGLMGVRCVEDKGVCINGYAKGLTPAELKEPGKNIEVGISILLAKKKALGSKATLTKAMMHYNGGTTDHGYAFRITAIVAATQGIQLPIEEKDTRMKMLTAQIISARREAVALAAKKTTTLEDLASYAIAPYSPAVMYTSIASN
jgi:hypothetical protein